MERLTFYENGKACYRVKEYSDFHMQTINKTISGSPVATKLATYEDAEEQGQLVVLPRKVGATVWLISGDVIHKCKVHSIELNDFPDWDTGRHSATLYTYDDCKKHSILWLSRAIGKTVFLTREEATAALEASDKNGR